MQNDNGILTPAEGMMLTNGRTYSDKVYIGRGDSAEGWHDAPMSDYEQWLTDIEI